MHLHHVVHHVAVAQHRALGDAGRAARVLQERNVGETEFDVIEFLLCAGAQRGRQANAAGQRERRHRFFDVFNDEIGDRTFRPAEKIADRGRDDVLDVCLGEHLLERIGEVLENDDAFCAGVFQLMFEFSWRIERIDVHRDQAGPKNTDECYRVLQHIRQHDRDTFAPGQTERLLQVASEAHRQVVDIPVGERAAEIRECRLIRKFRERKLGHVAERLEFGGRNFCRNAFRI